MPFVDALQALYEVIEDLDSGVLNRKKVLRLRLMEKVLNEFLRGYVSFFWMGYELFDWTLKVGLLKRAATCAEPSDKIVGLHIAFVLNIDELKNNLPSVFKVEILVS